MEFNIFKIVLINVWVFELRIKDVDCGVESMKIKKKLKAFNVVGFGPFEMTKFVYIIVNVGHERKKMPEKKKSGNCMGQCFCVSEVGIE